MEWSKDQILQYLEKNELPLNHMDKLKGKNFTEYFFANGTEYMIENIEKFKRLFDLSPENAKSIVIFIVCIRQKVMALFYNDISLQIFSNSIGSDLYVFSYNAFAGENNMNDYLLELFDYFHQRNYVVRELKYTNMMIHNRRAFSYIMEKFPTAIKSELNELFVYKFYEDAIKFGVFANVNRNDHCHALKEINKHKEMCEYICSFNENYQYNIEILMEFIKIKNYTPIQKLVYGHNPYVLRQLLPPEIFNNLYREHNLLYNYVFDLTDEQKEELRIKLRLKDIKDLNIKQIIQDLIDLYPWKMYKKMMNWPTDLLNLIADDIDILCLNTNGLITFAQIFKREIPMLAYHLVGETGNMILEYKAMYGVYIRDNEYLIRRELYSKMENDKTWFENVMKKNKKLNPEIIPLLPIRYVNDGTLIKYLPLELIHKLIKTKELKWQYIFFSIIPTIDPYKYLLKLISRIYMCLYDGLLRLYDDVECFKLLVVYNCQPTIINLDYVVLADLDIQQCYLDYGILIEYMRPFIIDGDLISFPPSETKYKVLPQLLEPFVRYKHNSLPRNDNYYHDLYFKWIENTIKLYLGKMSSETRSIYIGKLQAFSENSTIYHPIAINELMIAKYNKALGEPYSSYYNIRANNELCNYLDVLDMKTPATKHIYNVARVEFLLNNPQFIGNLDVVQYSIYVHNSKFKYAEYISKQENPANFIKNTARFKDLYTDPDIDSTVLGLSINDIEKNLPPKTDGDKLIVDLYIKNPNNNPSIFTSLEDFSVEMVNKFVMMNNSRGVPIRGNYSDIAIAKMLVANDNIDINSLWGNHSYNRVLKIAYECGKFTQLHNDKITCANGLTIDVMIKKYNNGEIDLQEVLLQCNILVMLDKNFYKTDIKELFTQFKLTKASAFMDLIDLKYIKVKMGAESSYGTVHELNENMVLKITKIEDGSLYSIHDSLTNKIFIRVPIYYSELLVGILLYRIVNTYTPNFVKTLGVAKYTDVTHQVLEKLQTGTLNHDCAYLLCLYQIARALHIAQIMTRFTHYDLHGNNVMYRKIEKKIAYKHKNEYVIIEKGFIPVIIDFGLSRMETEKYVILPNSSRHEHSEFNPYFDIQRYIVATAYDIKDINIKKKVLSFIDYDNYKANRMTRFDFREVHDIGHIVYPSGVTTHQKTLLEIMDLLLEMIRPYKSNNFSIKDHTDEETIVYEMPNMNDVIHWKMVYTGKYDYDDIAVLTYYNLPGGVRNTLKPFNRIAVADPNKQRLHIATIPKNSNYKIRIDCCYMNPGRYLLDNIIDHGIVINGGLSLTKDSYSTIGPVSINKNFKTNQHIKIPDSYQKYYCYVYIDNNVLHLDTTLPEGITSYFMSGPMLIWDEKIVFTDEIIEQNPSLFQWTGNYNEIPPGHFNDAGNQRCRTALIINKNGDYILIHSEQVASHIPTNCSGLDIPQLAQICQHFNADRAVALASGIPTDLYAKRNIDGKPVLYNFDSPSVYSVPGATVLAFVK